MTDFYSSTLVKKSRKPCKCEGCGKDIPAGSQVRRISGSYDGEFYYLAQHPECHDAEVWINRENGWSGEEWSRLDSLEEQEDMDAVAAEFPIVGGRMGWKITAKEEW